MDVGLGLPQTGRNATREHVAAVARAAEESGYAAIWVSDHVVYPREYTSLHPDQPGGRLPAHFDNTSNLLEPLSVLAFAAGITERIRIGTSVLVLPMRQPVLHAKIIASIDHLGGGGRFILGAGLGWAREEFEVLSAPWERRGARIEEQVQLMRALWSGDWVDHHGEFFEVDGWISRPAPPRPIPVWLGGATPASFRRAGRLADGWLAGIYRWATYPEDVIAVKRAAEQAGRDPESLTFAMGGLPRLAPGREEDTARSLREAAALGVQHARVGVEARPGEAAELIADFARRYLDDLRAL
jgi:probable F420-dependent oxidoreductase